MSCQHSPSMILGLVLIPYIICAADTDLDQTFGLAGKVTTPSGYAYALALQSDGKILVAGNNKVARYNSDGSLDPSFDGDGVATNAIAANGYDLAIQADGKIVVVGTKTVSSGRSYFAVAKFNSDGSPDTTFDGDGVLTTDIGENHDAANGVAIQSDGKIVAAGRAYPDAFGDNITIARYNADGSLDTSFDSDGIVRTELGSGSCSAWDVAVQSDGKIVVVGYYHDGHTDTAVVRYNSDGADYVLSHRR